MNINWENITAALTALATLYGLLRKVINNSREYLKKMILSETTYISQQLRDQEKQITKLSREIDSLQRSITELKTMERSSRSAISQLEIGIRAAIQDNTKAIQDAKKTEAEWLSDALIKIKGMANKG
jgi:DNA repair exonuclease SbcCD ATPase subunit